MSNHSHSKVGCDAHPGQPARAGKDYSLFAVCDGKEKVLDRVRVNYERGAIQGFFLNSHLALRSPWRRSAMGIGSATRSPVLAGQAGEAANVVVRQQHHSNWRNKYIVLLYQRTRRRKGHAVTVGTVARCLAEATYWVLTKGEPYREPVPRRPVAAKPPVSLRQGQARA